MFLAREKTKFFAFILLKMEKVEQKKFRHIDEKNGGEAKKIGKKFLETGKNLELPMIK